MFPVVCIWVMPHALMATTPNAARYTRVRPSCTARTNVPTTRSTHTLSRWVRWCSVGSGNHVNSAGIKTMLMPKATMMFNAATTPNSMSTGLCVKMNVANPKAVVALVKSVALPTLVTIRCSAIILLPWRLNSAWYLLTK